MGRVLFEFTLSLNFKKMSQMYLVLIISWNNYLISKSCRMVFVVFVVCLFVVLFFNSVISSAYWLLLKQKQKQEQPDLHQRFQLFFFFFSFIWTTLPWGCGCLVSSCLTGVMGLQKRCIVSVTISKYYYIL